MTRRAIIHIGVYKTGTSTIQTTLEGNREKFSKDFTLKLAPELEGAPRASRGYSLRKDPNLLIEFENNFEAVVQDWLHSSQTNLVISSEGLMGLPPGRRGVRDFSAAPILIRIMDDIFRRQSETIGHEFYLSLREQNAWEFSLYWHNVAVCKMKLSLEEFREQFGKPNQLLATLQKLQDAVPQTKLSFTMLEDTKNMKLGPAEPIITLMYPNGNIPDNLLPTTTRNARKSQIYLDACLTINRIPNLKKRERQKLKYNLRDLSNIPKL